MTEENTPYRVGANHLQVALAEFNDAMKIFAKSRRILSDAQLVYENGQLLLGTGDRMAVMAARGNWQGKAVFSGGVLHALAKIPPQYDPLPIRYAEGRLLIGNLTLACRWYGPSDEFIAGVLDPSMIDLLAMARNMPHAEIKGSRLALNIRHAKSLAARRLKKAAELLADFEISHADLASLLEKRIVSRIKNS